MTKPGKAKAPKLQPVPIDARYRGIDPVPPAADDATGLAAAGPDGDVGGGAAPAEPVAVDAVAPSAVVIVERMPRLIVLDKLAHADTNVRRGGKADIEQLAANILAHGLLQNLVGTEAADGSIAVLAGGRRLKALQLLARQKRIPKDYLVSVQVLDADGLAGEASLSENFQRLNMNAGAEAEEFARLVREGADIAGIAARFGLTERHVEQRLRLADLHPVVLDALKAGKISLDIAKAFASLPDQARQAVVFKDSKFTGPYPEGPEAVRRRMAETGRTGDHAWPQFVGREAYTAAGGAIETDLFADKRSEVWTSLDLLEKLARQKLAEVAAAEQQRHGFARVIPAFSYTEKAEQTEGLVRADMRNCDMTQQPSDVRAHLVVLLELGGDGTPKFNTWDAWLHDASVPVKMPEPEPEPEDCDDGDCDDDGLEPEAVAPEPEDDGLKPMAGPLRDALAMRRRDGLALALLGDPQRARDLALFLLLENAAVPTSSYSSENGFTARISTPDNPIVAGFREELPWHGDALDLALAERRGCIGEEGPQLDDGWRHLKTAADRWAAFIELPVEHRLHWGAVAMSHAIHPWGNRFSRSPTRFHDAVAASLGCTGVSPDLWRPTAENYFDRAKKARCLAFLEEVFDPGSEPGAGAPVDAKPFGKLKSGELSSACEALAAGDSAKLGDIGPAREQIEARAKTWMPAELKFAAPKGGAA